MMRGTVEHPEGLVALPELLSEERHAELLDVVTPLEFKPFIFRGIQSKREIVQYGHTYDYQGKKLGKYVVPPSWLDVLCREVEEVAGFDEGSLDNIIIHRYPVGAGISEHRDNPVFGKIASVVLNAPCDIRFRLPIEGELPLVYEEHIDPGGGYVLDGAARYDWWHHITPAKELRYSVTMRTLSEPNPN